MDDLGKLEDLTLGQPSFTENRPPARSASQNTHQRPLIDLLSEDPPRGRSSPSIHTIPRPTTDTVSPAVSGVSHSPRLPYPSHNRPSPLPLPTDWLPASWTAQKQKWAMPGRNQFYPRSFVAKFIISDKEDLSVEMIKAIYDELKRKEGGHIIELRETPPNTFIHIEASSERETQNLVEAARVLANELASEGSATTSALFQEPLAPYMNNLRVTLDIQDSGVRPILDLPLNESPKRDHPRAFVMDLSRAIYHGLKKTSRLHSSLALEVHLGHFVLQSFPRGQSSLPYERLRTMVDSPRASGRLTTEMTNEGAARHILAIIRRSEGPLLPTDNQIPSAADVMPDYIFEAHSEQGKLQADIVMTANDAKRSPTGSPHYQMDRVRTFHGNSSLPELSFTIFSIGRQFDWSIEASRDETMVNTTKKGITEYLASATIHLQGDDFERYPHIVLWGNDMMNHALRNITIKSVYRFRWNTSPYTIEIAINRRWDRISNMRKPPKVDFGITIHDDHWDQRSQSGTQAAENTWGDDSNLLFKDGNDTASGVDRIERFVSVVQGVQDVFENA